MCFGFCWLSGKATNRLVYPSVNNRWHLPLDGRFFLTLMRLFSDVPDSEWVVRNRAGFGVRDEPKYPYIYALLMLILYVALELGPFRDSKGLTVFPILAKSMYDSIR